MFNKRVFFLLVFLCANLIIGESNANDVSGKYNIEPLTKMAEDNDVNSQTMLGRIYLEGKYTGQDLSKAEYWLEKAVGNHSADAAVDLSYLYANYYGNINGAIKILLPFSKEENKDIIYNLAFLYEQNNDVKNTIYWYSVLSEYGDADAQYNLALLLSKQSENNHKEIIKLLNQSLNIKASDDAMFLLSISYLDYEDVRDVDKGLYLLNKVAEKGMALAEHKLGKIYQEGKLLPKNIDESNKWLARAKIHGYRED